MEDKKQYMMEESVSQLPPRSERHRRKRIKRQKQKGTDKAEETSSGIKFNFQLLFLRFLVFLFLLMIVLVIMYPDWLQKL